MRQLTAIALLGVLCWGLAILTTTGSAPGATGRFDLSADVKRIVARDVAAIVPANGAGGVAVAVRIAGRTLFANYGYADAATRRPITSDLLFNVASVRKVFEATLVAQGVQSGELRLGDPVYKYVPELQGDYIRQVTIGQLATHTSGLLLPSDHPPWPTEHYSLSGFFDALNAFKPSNGEQPGKQRIYTHAGYVLLQIALERRYGMPISELIERAVVVPLGMNSTLIPERGANDRALMSSQLLERAVQGYSHDGQPIGLPGNQQGYYDFPGTGQMFSSVRDLAVLVAACLDDVPVGPKLRAALQLTQRDAFRLSPQYAQAMAWEVNDLGGLRILDKPGGLDNASAYIGLVPEQKIGIVLLINRGDAFPHEIARNTLLPELARLQAQSGSLGSAAHWSQRPRRS